MQLVTSAAARAMMGRNALGRMAMNNAWRASKWGRRYNAAVKVGRFIYKNRKNIGRGYRKAKRMRIMRKGWGDPPGGNGTAHTTLQTQPGVTIRRDTRTLYVNSLTDISRGGTDQIDERQRNLANVRGLKLNFEVINTSGRVMYWNCALLVQRNQDHAFPITSQAFFRAYDNSRQQDFSDALGSLEFHSLPINVDKYRVLMHKRFRLAEENTNNANEFKSNSGRNYLNYSRYIRLNKQFQFKAGLSTAENANVWLVYWADQFGAEAGSASLSEIFRISENHYCYWREPKP